METNHFGCNSFKKDLSVSNLLIFSGGKETEHRNKCIKLDGPFL